MNHLHLSSKIHDIWAVLAGGGAIAFALSDVEMIVKIVIGILTIIFMALGILIRAREIRRGDGKSGD